MHACSVVSNSLQHGELQHTRLLFPWDFPGKNTGVGCHFFLQGIFPTQGRNLHLLHWQAGFLPLSHHRSPINKYIDVVLSVKIWLVWFNHAWTCCAPKWIHVFYKFWKFLNLLKYFLVSHYHFSSVVFPLLDFLSEKW